MSAHFDVVVVGYGAAGAAAAIAAHDAGARVLIVEKMPYPGGLSVVSAGGARIAYDADAAARYLIATCGGRTPPDVLRRLAQGMVELPGWMQALAKEVDASVRVFPALGNYPFEGFDQLGYVEVDRLQSDATPLPPTFYSNAGTNFFGLLRQCVERRGIEVRLGTAAKSLLRTASGVHGLRIEHEGQSETVDARGGVILACGGFEANAQMQSQYFEATGTRPASFLGNTGDGITMAQALGADLWHMWHFHGPYGFRHPDPAFRYGLYAKNFPMWTPGHHPDPLPPVPWILVDQRGRRFANEYEPYPGDTGVRHFAHFDAASAAHSRLPAYLIVDRKGLEMYPLGRAIANDPAMTYRWSEDNLAEVELGILRRAESLPALATALGMDPVMLETQVRQWNAACDAGRDDAYDRRPETMLPLLHAPYYAAEVWPLVINTQGGPVHDAHQRVIDVRGEPIEGLYAAGELGSVFGHIYLAGGNLAECVVGGRNAARHLAHRLER
ncbi:FAD-binding dehydrogenase [Bordetella genomosp. 10]|uniref:FAD-binding dehydrogenase n=1 Tax=Bordetella genomosp. 10 TaxID=1416804 RepID=A0A261SCG5_9BORD|nr:FAD-dependent oxidoreductase [Bordetella genomosp. 10]OZI35089.1 FAD-binding dehydrogenase [Bordetella genomosp. 10]